MQLFDAWFCKKSTAFPLNDMLFIQNHEKIMAINIYQKKSLVYKWKDITKYSGLKPGKQCNLEKPHCFFLIFRMELPSILSGMSGKWFVFTFFSTFRPLCVLSYISLYFFSSYRSFTFNEQLCSLQIEKYCHSNCVNERFHDYIQS